MIRQRAYFERELEKRILHTNPLGKDRDYNRYWWFKRDGRVFVESSDSKLWGYYCCKEEVAALNNFYPSTLLFISFLPFE